MEQDTNTTASMGSAPDRGFSGASYVMGGALVVIMLIVGGWYLMNKDDMMMDMDMQGGMMAETTAPVPGTAEEVAASEAATVAATTALTTQGTSDELGAIEADLNATDLNSLGDPSQL